jgi:hypothetical protein
VADWDREFQTSLASYAVLNVDIVLTDVPCALVAWTLK